MEQARKLTEQYMAGRAAEAPADAPTEKVPAPGFGGMAQAAAARFLGADDSASATAAEGGDKPASAAVGSPLMGMAQHYLSKGEPGTGDKPASGAGGLMSAATALMGGGDGGSVMEGATAEGSGKADAGLVDKLLSLYMQTQGKQARCVGGGGRPAQLRPAWPYKHPTHAPRCSFKAAMSTSTTSWPAWHTGRWAPQLDATCSSRG